MVELIARLPQPAPGRNGHIEADGLNMSTNWKAGPAIFKVGYKV